MENDVQIPGVFLGLAVVVQYHREHYLCVEWLKLQFHARSWLHSRARVVVNAINSER